MTPPKDVIARAVASGLIDGTGITQSSKDTSRKSGKRKRKKTNEPFKASLFTTISFQQKCVQKKGSGPKAYNKPAFKF